jgi:hypothetical protein
VIPKLFGGQGSGAYWADFDWTRSVEAGMKAAGLPFSGTVGFVETEMYWPITHMVAPKEQALRCDDCHHPGGRLADLDGFYMPRRDSFRFLDLFGWLGIGLTAAGVTAHGGLRYAFARRRARAGKKSTKGK